MSLAHASTPYEFAARASDVVLVTPHDRAGVKSVLAQVDEPVTAVGRDVRAHPLKRFAELLVFLDDEPGAAARRKARLDALDGADLASDAEIFRAPPATSPTCCSTGEPPASTASGCAPAPCRTISPRSLAAWSPNCSDGGRSARPTTPRPYAGTWG